MKEQLKPCPSCGAKNTDKVTLISELYDADKYKYGKCFQCGIRMYDWNKRPIEDALQAEIETLTGKLDSAKYSDAQFREKAKLLQVELDQLRKDNQALVEQINAVRQDIKTMQYDEQEEE